MKMTGQRFSVLLRVLVIASAAVPLVAGYFLPMSYRRAESVNWPTTSGTVGDFGLKTSFQKPGRTTYFSPFVCYSYVVDGIPRTSTRIDFGDPRIFPKEEALLWLNQNYPVGKQVKVYYDSSDPDLAVLVPGATDLVFTCWAVFITGIGLLGASLILLIRDNKRRGAYGGASGVLNRER